MCCWATLTIILGSEECLVLARLLVVVYNKVLPFLYFFEMEEDGLRTISNLTGKVVTLSGCLALQEWD